MAGIGHLISVLSALKAAYVAGGDTSAFLGNSSLKDNKTNTAISLSFLELWL